MLPRRRWHRRTFLLAGGSNIGWGRFTVADPQGFFRFTGPPPLDHPGIFGCLGMVGGRYGPIDLQVARTPERRGVLAAVVRCLPDDLLWWIPFALYLHDAWPGFRTELIAGQKDTSP